MVRRMLAVAALLAVSIGFGGCGGVKTPGAHASDGPPRVTLDSAAAKEKLGQDDGFHGTIFYGAELAGSIDDCGCPGHPQGGLPWRLGYTEGFRAAYPEAGYLQVDAGHSMANIIDVSGKLYPDQKTKNEWVLKAFDRFNFDAANISHNDIYFLAQFLRSGVWEQETQKHPMLARFVSANLEPEKPDSGLLAPPAYVVRTMTGKRIPGGSIRVAIIGLTENNPNLPTHTGFKVVAPDVALDRVLPRARAESDIVVVLYFAAPDAAKVLADTIGSKVNAFIVAGPRARDTEPSFTNLSNIAYARYQTRNLGELRLRLDGKNVAGITNRYVTLDEQLPKDPIAEQMAAEAKESIKKAQEERFANSAPPIPGGK
jgi:hypothetical protein